jgi:hypothetical protein
MAPLPCSKLALISRSATPSAFNELFSVAAVSANNIWAVGEFLDPSLNEYQTLTEHWDGTSWSVIPSPNATAGRNYLAGVTALSTGDVVAVGGANSPDNQTGTDLILANNEPLGSAPVPPANPPPGPTPSPGIIDYVGQQSIPTTGLSPVSPSALWAARTRSDPAEPIA